jgi:tetraacyldisaccharide 4'-kinase
MGLHTPGFWRSDNAASRLLLPLAGAYEALIRARRAMIDPRPMDLPVMAVGNLVAGGAGKTPVTQAIVRLLKGRGLDPFVLTRGYGGRKRGPLLVDMACHTACQVGDEAVLHAAICPTVVSRDRMKGALFAKRHGARVLVMDDGLQNRRLKPGLGLLIVDGSYGLGNGRMLPAGPLREPLDQCLSRVDAVVIVGEDLAGVSALLPANLPRFRVDIVPDPHAARLLEDQDVLGFAGMARPEKFFHTLTETGAHVVEAVAFPDHYRYQPRDIDALLTRAEALHAQAVTTQKDWVKIPVRYHGRLHCLPVQAKFRDAHLFEAFIQGFLSRWGAPS